MTNYTRHEEIYEFQPATQNGWTVHHWYNIDGKIEYEALPLAGWVTTVSVLYHRQTLRPVLERDLSEERDRIVHPATWTRWDGLITVDELNESSNAYATLTGPGQEPPSTEYAEREIREKEERHAKRRAALAADLTASVQ